MNNREILKNGEFYIKNKNKKLRKIYMNQLIKNKEPIVSIVFLNWNGKKETFGLLESLKKIKYKNYDIIVVDNGSSDGTQKEFKKKYGKIATLIENKKNLGEAEGLNVGIREALRRKSDYVLTMDNDTYVDKEFLNFLVDSMEKHPEVAVAGPKIYYSDPDNIIWSAGCDYHFRGFRSRYQKQKDIGQANRQEYVDAVDCVLLMRAEVLHKVGILNGEFFTMHETSGWCLRVSKKRYKVLYVPKSKIWHKVSATWNKFERGKEMSIYYDTRNWLLCTKQNENTLYFTWILFLELTALFFIRSLRWIRRGQIKFIKTYFTAIWHALINKTPMRLYPYK